MEGTPGLTGMQWFIIPNLLRNYKREISKGGVPDGAFFKAAQAS